MTTPDTAPDATLVTRIASRDPEALAALYDRHRSIVFTLALRMLGDRGRAEEILADVFLRAWSLAPGYGRAPGSVPGWLLHLCRMSCLEKIRAGRVGSSPGSAEPAQASTDGTEIPASLREKRRRILEILSLLSAEQREAIEAAYYGDLIRKDRSAGGLPEEVRERFTGAVMALRVNLSAALAVAGSGEEER